jgi:CGNR zinc finger
MQLGSPGRPPPPLPRRAALPRLVHTGGEGALERFEIVNHPDDLGRLLGVILGLPPLPANVAELAAMRPLRAALTRTAYWCSMELCGNHAKIRTHRSGA